MSHLGDRVSALVDGELSHSERDRLLAHVTCCPACRAEVDAARALKARLTALGCPAPSASLTARLHALAEPGGPLPPARPRMPGGPGVPPRTAALGSPMVSGGRPARHGPSWGRRLTFAAASFAAGTLTTAFLVGGQSQPPGAPVVPPVDEFAVEHAGTSGDIPLTDPAVAAVTVGGTSQPLGVVGTADAVGVVPRGQATASPFVVPVLR